MSGDQTLLDEVRKTLQACGETVPCHSGSLSSSVVISIDGNSHEDFAAECEPVSLDFLSAEVIAKCWAESPGTKSNE
jgi:hypothetical protein